MSELEASVKADIRRLLAELKAWQYMPVQFGYGVKGVPDHIACVPLKITPSMVGRTLGIFVGVEAKRLGKEPDAHQWLQLNSIKDAGGAIFVVDGTKSEKGSFEAFERTLNLVFKTHD